MRAPSLSSAAASAQVVVVIPARYAATRLPGKPLALIAGKPMIQRVWERIRHAQSASRVIIATDDERIRRAAQDFGVNAADVVMTSPDLQSGTDRVAAVADQVPADIYVNVQGDEPLMEPGAIDAAVELITSGRFEMSSVMTPLRTHAELDEISVVKVIADRSQRAIYFSRFPIPYSRGARPVDVASTAASPFVCRRHVGLYAYTRDLLLRFRSLPVSAIERGESLEQLRALENGIAIGMAEADFLSIGVDTPQDLETVNALWQSKKSSSL